MIEFVLDSSALLAEIFMEPGAERVAAARPTAAISAVNYAEVIAKLVDEGLSPQEAEDTAEQLRCEVVEADKHRSILSALLRGKTQRKGISLADRYCLQLAMELGAPLLTTDRIWASLGLDIDVVVTR
jgi:PIN domain nuclease of toxin-antitoxin system